MVEDGQLGHRRYATLPVSRNGKQHPTRPRIELDGATASPEEAAAIAAAIEQFLRDTAPPPATAGSQRRRGCGPACWTRRARASFGAPGQQPQDEPGLEGGHSNVTDSVHPGDHPHPDRPLLLPLAGAQANA